MQGEFSGLFVNATLFTVALGSMAFAQAPPADFLLKATAGGRAPWSQSTMITIDGLGHATGTRYSTGGVSPVIAETTFTISGVRVQLLWKAIQDSSFFGLTSPPPDTTISDGVFAKITVTANGAAHQVLVRNTAQSAVQSLIDSVNAGTPPSFQLMFEPPVQLNNLPGDPCVPLLGVFRSDPRSHTKPFGFPPLSMPAQSKVSSTSTTASGFHAPSPPSTLSLSSIESVVIPHPGAVVAYDVPIEEAVTTKIATLKSKGQFFGDAISLTVDNRVPKPSDAITITLYLEFWGPLAWQGNVDPIVNDIVSKWSGHTTSSGKEVHVDVVTRLNRTAIAPPNTPGYDDIFLQEPGTVRGYVNALPGMNTGTVGGVWEVAADRGVYAHEAGHLLGLPDRYDDYNKQADGSWVNANTGTKYANDDLFAPYYASKNPGTSVADAKAYLQKTDLVGVTKDGAENDLMGNYIKPVSQSDIDLITANPGILVRVPEGVVLVNKSGGSQNIVVTHAEDLFVKAGEKRSLNGIYGACIDAHRSIPDSLGLFDVAPSIGDWTGIPAAGVLAKLIHFTDSVGMYCPLNFPTQAAIWRITDNSLLLFDNDAQTLLGLAGITLGDQVLDFPHLTTRSVNDSTTSTFVPDELFAADIQPRFVEGSPGNKVTFDATLSQPVNAGFSTEFSWTAKSPDTTDFPISTNGTSGSLTPIASGMYEVGLTITATDSASIKRTFKAPGKAYVVVPDSVTETFEHAHLSDKFPWRTEGDVPWSVSSTNAQTGSFSAQAGAVAPQQSSGLAIDLALPKDGAITFSIRTATVEFANQCQFLIDSVFVNEFSGVTDWNVFTYPLKAGIHTLEWISTGSTAGKVWLDNVFFPPHSLVTSTKHIPGVLPAAFVLYQNYPNPFNPETGIRYQVSGVSRVRLVVYDVLGRQVAVLVDGIQTSGEHEVRFDGGNLSSGVYFYRLTAGSFSSVRTMLLIR